ncbi:hydroxyethylthiazole kinase [Granulicoccus phenolivorans]|uniref:hydroxyethylthiazole kinase n=1 Tax=Granulicoccus phenolivorans TaxID=266854 RepID=UPI000408F74E|nr:hydroxyethylthiazole kinase [Granulicoccus phenolivorans]
MVDPGVATEPGAVLAAVRDRAPVVHCLTASVTENFVADALLAAGARPMMTNTPTEAPAMVAVADALLINLGTLSTDGAAAMEPTVIAARRRGLPWVLDPAAIGIAPVRTPLAHRLLGLAPAVVRGNASEIQALAGAGTGGRGADSTAEAAAVVEDAVRLAGGSTGSGPVVALSGAVDVITTGTRVIRVRAGHRLLTRVTGTGCALGALTAACCAVTDPLTAAVTATLWLGLAGERAADRAPHPGSFRIALLDDLDALTPADLTKGTERCQ